ncbi:MAG: hypothetical protein H6839_14915 [Planctomycetes bacterium]|nr:hypothetical protein [Planctomycetota bacterium]
MIKVIARDELKRALDAGRVDGLYDNRGPGSYANLHIKGAQQLSVSAVKEHLPADVNAMLVFY